MIPGLLIFVYLFMFVLFFFCLFYPRLTFCSVFISSSLTSTFYFYIFLPFSHSVIFLFSSLSFLKCSSTFPFPSSFIRLTLICFIPLSSPHFLFPLLPCNSKSLPFPLLPNPSFSLSIPSFFSTYVSFHSLCLSSYYPISSALPPSPTPSPLPPPFPPLTTKRKSHWGSLPDTARKRYFGAVG